MATMPNCIIKRNIKMKIFGILAALFVGVLLITGVVMYFSYNNEFTRKENQFKAQENVDKAFFDEMWKVIKQQAGVSEKYSEDFRRNYKEIMTSRNYGGEMMKWITEANPNFTPDLYSKLMNTIEIKRAEFTNNQKKLISIHKELSDLKMLFPGSLFLGSRNVPDLNVVTSSQTEAVFQTHKDDDIELFEKDTVK